MALDNIPQLTPESNAEPEGLDSLIAGSNNPQQPESQPSVGDEPEGLDELIRPIALQEKYGTPGQQVKAGVEGLGRGLIGPLAPLAEKAMGVSSEDILGREEANPTLHFSGEAAGLLGGSLLGTGEAALASKIGDVGAHALGLGEMASTAGKIGSAAVKGAIENMAIQGGDETSKMILSDPNQTAQTALTNVGLGALIGGVASGAIGAVSPLWSATEGKSTHGLLTSIANRMGGIEDVAPDAVSEAIESSGMDISPEIKAGMSQDPNARQMFQHLQESSTGAGRKAQEALKQFHSDASDAITSALGKTESDISDLNNLSESDSGNAIKKSLSNSLKETMDPISEQFEKIKAKYSQEDLSGVTKSKIANDIAQMSNTEGYNKAPSSSQAALIQTTLKEIPLQTTLQDLNKYQSILGDKTYNNPELSRVGAQLKKILRSAEDDTVQAAAGRAAPGAIQEHADARMAYGKAMSAIDDLNDRLHVGRFNGPASFHSALKDMSPEDVLRRLSPKNDSEVIPLLQNISPETSELLRDFHLSQTIKGASDGENIVPNKLFARLDKLSPEMRNFVVPQDAQSKIKGIQALMESVPKKMNNSGTAKTLDSLWSKIPGSAMAMAAMVHGNNPATGFVMGTLAKYLGRDVPDAIKLAILKFLGSAKAVDAPAFKSAVDYIHAASQGDAMLSKASKNVFKAGTEVLPDSAFPSERDRTKLDNQLKQLQKDPSPLFKSGGNLGTYMEGHETAVNTTATRAASYLNSIRPSTSPRNPLDTPVPVTPEQKTAYNRALDLANNPSIIMKDIKNGTVKPKDILTFNSMYPELYNKIKMKLLDDMNTTLSKGQIVPYSTRMGLSMFTGQALDSTMTPEGIMAAQPQPQQPGAQPQAPGATKAKHSTAPLTKMSSMYETQTESSQRSKQRIK